MARSLEDQVAERKAWRLAQRAEGRAVRTRANDPSECRERRRADRPPAQATRKASLHDQLIELTLNDNPNAKRSGFRKSLVKFWESQPYANRKNVLGHVSLDMGAKDYLRENVVPDAYCWMPEPDVPEDHCIGLHIFEVVVSHDISDHKAYYYNVLNEAGFYTSPKVQVWMHRIDKFNIDTVWDPEAYLFGFGPYAIRPSNHLIKGFL